MAVVFAPIRGVACLFGLSCRAMGIKLVQFIPGFAIVYLISLVMFTISGWADSNKYNLEAALLALVFGLVVSNRDPLPGWFNAACGSNISSRLASCFSGTFRSR